MDETACLRNSAHNIQTCAKPDLEIALPRWIHICQHQRQTKQNIMHCCFPTKLIKTTLFAIKCRKSIFTGKIGKGIQTFLPTKTLPTEELLPAAWICAGCALVLTAITAACAAAVGHRHYVRATAVHDIFHTTTLFFPVTIRESVGNFERFPGKQVPDRKPVQGRPSNKVGESDGALLRVKCLYFARNLKKRDRCNCSLFGRMLPVVLLWFNPSL